VLKQLKINTVHEQIQVYPITALSVRFLSTWIVSFKKKPREYGIKVLERKIYVYGKWNNTAAKKG
jgi:hypothetical protein